MNKYQEAWNFLMGDGKMKVDKWGESLDTIHELVEKATPKKISKKVDRLKYNHYFCNSCSAYLGSEFLPKGNYCPTCGQKIDWSEEDVD